MTTHCPRCGELKQRADWVACFGCLVTFDDEAIADFAAARDGLRGWLDTEARWLEDARVILDAMPDDDPRQFKGQQKWDGRMEYWREREALYKRLCWLLKDVAPERAEAAA